MLDRFHRIKAKFASHLRFGSQWKDRFIGRYKLKKVPKSAYLLSLFFLILISLLFKKMRTVNRSYPPEEDIFNVSDPGWSSSWPRVHQNDCSCIMFMNRGINSPEVTPKLTFYPRTGIVSAPGSGNTWLRHIIEQATGLWTGSVFFDEDLYRGGFRGKQEDCKVDSTVAIKAHILGQDDVQFGCYFDRIILVVRDLYHGLLAEFNRQQGKGHTKEADEETLHSTLWKSYIREFSGWSANLVLDWIRRYKGGGKSLGSHENPFIAPHDFWDNILFVSYERLKRDPVIEADRMLKFLRIPVFRKHCVEANAQGNFKRVHRNESIAACLYREPVMRKIVEKSKKHLLHEARKIGVGNILSEDEGMSDIINELCQI